MKDLARFYNSLFICLCFINSNYTRFSLIRIEDDMKRMSVNHDSIAALSSRLNSIENIVKTIPVDHESIMAQSTKLIPIGFIYIQYQYQVSPIELWPIMRWTDVTSDFAGQFFRALGGNSAAWGQVQNSCAPRISII